MSSCPPRRAPLQSLPPAGEVAAALAPVIAARGRTILRDPGHRAGVLILLYDREAVPHVVLTKRTHDLAHHRGQVSLPGGVWESGDLGLRATALRETEEELGVPARAIQVVGQLDDVATAVSGFIISPFVGVLDSHFVPRPSAREIARVLEVALTDLVVADALLPEQPTLATLRYPLLEEDVWGATARILHAFVRLVSCALGRG